MLCSVVGLCLGHLSSCTSASPSLWFPFQDPLPQVLHKNTSLAPSFFLSPLCLLTCCLPLSPGWGFTPLSSQCSLCHFGHMGTGKEQPQAPEQGWFILWQSSQG